MSNKVFIAIIAFLLIGAIGYTVVRKKSEPALSRPGIEQEDTGRQHVNGLTARPNTAAEPPTSGDHDPQPLPWQVYDQEVPDAKITHNMEHGGVVITYRSDIPQAEINKIKAAFSKPFANKGFQPSKVLVAPRKANDAPIIMSSWRRSEKFETADIQKMTEYYQQNIGKSPEPTAG